jgi:hypothetical protein
MIHIRSRERNSAITPVFPRKYEVFSILTIYSLTKVSQTFKRVLEFI